MSKSNSLSIGQTVKVNIEPVQDVVIRSIDGDYITVSLGFDSKGKDITCVLSKNQIINNQ